MGTYSHAEGMITIHPPLNHNEVRRYREWCAPVKNERGRWSEAKQVVLDIETEESDIDGGHLIVDSAMYIEPDEPGRDEYKRYHTEKDLRDLMDLFPDHVFSGYIEQESEGYGDAREHFRLVAHGNELTRIEPEMHWPHIEGVYIK